MEITELFEMEFTDKTKLWASEQNGKLTVGTLGNGICTVIREFLQTIPYSHVCMFALNYSKKSDLVLSYKDTVQEKSNELAKQLLKAF